ncbi:MAG: hypothetical protein Q9202_005065 [Teloschistes flavicans]
MSTTTPTAPVQGSAPPSSGPVTPTSMTGDAAAPPAPSRNRRKRRRRAAATNITTPTNEPQEGDSTSGPAAASPSSRTATPTSIADDDAAARAIEQNKNRNRKNKDGKKRRKAAAKARQAAENAQVASSSSNAGDHHVEDEEEDAESQAESQSIMDTEEDAGEMVGGAEPEAMLKVPANVTSAPKEAAGPKQPKGESNGQTEETASKAEKAAQENASSKDAGVDESKSVESQNTIDRKDAGEVAIHLTGAEGKPAKGQEDGKSNDQTDQAAGETETAQSATSSTDTVRDPKEGEDPASQAEGQTSAKIEDVGEVAGPEPEQPTTVEADVDALPLPSFAQPMALAQQAGEWDLDMGLFIMGNANDLPAEEDDLSGEENAPQASDSGSSGSDIEPELEQPQAQNGFVEFMAGIVVGGPNRVVRGMKRIALWFFTAVVTFFGFIARAPFNWLVLPIARFGGWEWAFLTWAYRAIRGGVWNVRRAVIWFVTSILYPARIPEVEQHDEAAGEDQAPAQNARAHARLWFWNRTAQEDPAGAEQGPENAAVEAPNGRDTGIPFEDRYQQAGEELLGHIADFLGLIFTCVWKWLVVLWGLKGPLIVLVLVLSSLSIPVCFYTNLPCPADPSHFTGLADDPTFYDDVLGFLLPGLRNVTLDTAEMKFVPNEAFRRAQTLQIPSLRSDFYATEREDFVNNFIAMRVAVDGAVAEFARQSAVAGQGLLRVANPGSRDPNEIGTKEFLRHLSIMLEQQAEGVSRIDSSLDRIPNILTRGDTVRQLDDLYRNLSWFRWPFFDLVTASPLKRNLDSLRTYYSEHTFRMHHAKLMNAALREKLEMKRGWNIRNFKVEKEVWRDVGEMVRDLLALLDGVGGWRRRFSEGF